MRFEVEDRRAVGEGRDADRLDVVGQKRAAAGQGVAAAGTPEDTKSTHRAAPAGADGIGCSALPPSPRVLASLHRRHDDHDADQRPLRDHHLPDRLAVGVTRCTAGSASASSRSSILGRAGRHGEPRAHLAVDLHRHDDLVGLGDRPDRTTATRPSASPSAWPSICHSSSAVCGANGEIITHQRVDRLAQRGDRLRPLDPRRPAARRATARRARCLR